MNKLGCNYSGSIQKLSCDRRDTDCIQAPLMGEPLGGDLAIDIESLTKTSLRFKTDNKKHLVCIDPRVENYQHLASGVKPGTEIIVLDGALDGVEQITEILAKRSLISSLQIVAHGGEASVQLRSTVLKDENLLKYDRHLQQWRNAFSETADILIISLQGWGWKIGDGFRAEAERINRRKYSRCQQSNWQCKIRRKLAIKCYSRTSKNPNSL